MIPHRFSLLAAGCLLLLVGATSRAATPGTDDASNSSYKQDDVHGWAAGTNGGTGFKAWGLVPGDTNDNRGYFLGDSRNVAPNAGGADINSGDKSFGMYAHGNGNQAEAYRSFDSSLAVGQTFSIDLAVNWRNGNKGFDLRSADGTAIFNFNVGGDDYVVNTASKGNGSISSAYDANTSFTLSFTQTSASGGTWTITRHGGTSQKVEGTYNGVADGFKLYVIGTDNGSENDLLANHLSITGSSH